MFLQASQKRLLSSLNPLIFVMAVFGVIMIRSTVYPLCPSLTKQLEVLLPFIIYVGQRRSVSEGLILTLFTSHLFSMASSASIGVFATLYLTIFVVARLLSFAIYANTWFSILLLMFSLAVFSRILLTIVSAFFGHGWPLFSSFNFVWWALILNTFLGFAFYKMLERLDRITFKIPAINIELMDNEL